MGRMSKTTNIYGAIDGRPLIGFTIFVYKFAKVKENYLLSYYF